MELTYASNNLAWERLQPLLPPPPQRRFRFPGRKPLVPDATPDLDVVFGMLRGWPRSRTRRGHDVDLVHGHVVVGKHPLSSKPPHRRSTRQYFQDYHESRPSKVGEQLLGHWHQTALANLLCQPVCLRSLALIICMGLTPIVSC
jgi:hypothetical protein